MRITLEELYRACGFRNYEFAIKFLRKNFDEGYDYYRLKPYNTRVYIVLHDAALDFLELRGNSKICKKTRKKVRDKIAEIEGYLSMQKRQEQERIRTLAELSICIQ